MIIYYTDDFSGGRNESHRLLEAAITEYTGDSGQAAALTGGMRTGEMGKPYIDGFDFFSISHTGSAWAVLISECECGLDIQEARGCNILTVSGRFYHQEDAAFVAAEAERDVAGGRSEFFRLWARREALVKAAGVSAADSRIPSVLGDRVDYAGRTFLISDIRVPGMQDLYAAVCAEMGPGVTGMDVRFEELIMADDKKEKKHKKSVAEAAYSYLANRMRTTAEVRKYLEGKEYGDDEITETINDLIGMRYLDDYLYAIRYYEHNREKKRGVMRAERELLEKGIDRETARNAKEDFLYEQGVDEFSDALEIARKEVYKPSDIYGEPPVRRELDDRLTAKIARKLESKGFSKGDIFRVLDEIRRSSDEE